MLFPTPQYSARA